jgi:hypothetical protein
MLTEPVFLLGHATAFDLVLDKVSQALAAGFPGLEHDGSLLGLKFGAQNTARDHIESTTRIAMTMAAANSTRRRGNGSGSFLAG